MSSLEFLAREGGYTHAMRGRVPRKSRAPRAAFFVVYVPSGCFFLAAYRGTVVFGCAPVPTLAAAATFTLSWLLKLCYLFASKRLPVLPSQCYPVWCLPTSPPKVLSVMIHQSLHREQQLTEALGSVAEIGVAKIHQVRAGQTRLNPGRLGSSHRVGAGGGMFLANDPNGPSIWYFFAKGGCRDGDKSIPARKRELARHVGAQCRPASMQFRCMRNAAY